MYKRLIRYITVLIICMTGFAVKGNAQFKEEAFSQTYNEVDSTAVADTSAQLFSFKELFRGLSHKDEIKIGTMFAGSMILPGSAQIYNKDYWKLPVIYGGIGAFAGTGGYYLHQYKKSKIAYNEYLEAKSEYESLNNSIYPFSHSWDSILECNMSIAKIAHHLFKNANFLFPSLFLLNSQSKRHMAIRQLT